MHAITDWWNRISLRTKITGVTVLLLTMGLIVVGVGTMAVLRTYLLEEVDKKIDAASQLDVGKVFTFSSNGGKVTCSVATFPTDFYLAMIDSSGDVVCSNRTPASGRPTSSRGVVDHVGAVTVSSTTVGGQWRMSGYPLLGVNGDPQPLSLTVGLDLRASNATISRFAAIFLFFGLTVVIFGGAVTRLLVTSTFTPLREVEATAARFADGDFNQRLGGATPNTEVGRLNRSLNSMLARIDSAFADRAQTISQMRRFVGDASHELRTPLVSVRGYAELYRMGALSTPDEVAQAMERIEKEAIRMGELVEDLLELARLDEAKPPVFAEVDLVPIAHDTALDAMASAPGRVVTVVSTVGSAPRTDDHARTASVAEASGPPALALELTEAENTDTPSKGTNAQATGPIAFAGATLARLRSRRPRVGAGSVQLTIGALTPGESELRAVVLAEENKIRQVLTNLMGNAMRFTTIDTPIEIGVGIDMERRMAVLSVIDHGEGIPPQIREKIFERFFRADSSRQRATGGSGLGLAIVAAIVRAHGGEVEALDTPGGGATFEVRLPLLPTAPDARALPQSSGSLS